MKPQNKTNGTKVGLVILVIIILIGIAYAWTSSDRYQSAVNSETDTGTASSTMTASSSPASTSSSSGVSTSSTASAWAPVTVPLLSTSGWQKLSSSTTGVTFEYPTATQLGLNYIQTTDWPPAITVSDAAFSCTPSGSAESAAGLTSIEVINNREYCVNVQSQGAAGSVYSQYEYSFPTNGETLTLNFTLRYPQCENYSDPQLTACSNEETAFNVDQLADTMAQTVQYIRLISPAHPMTPVNAASSTSITLNSITPASGKIGATITLTGVGFLSDNKVLFNGNVGYNDATIYSMNNATQSIVITVPSSLTADCKANQACPQYAILVTPGTYNVSVENANGDSNTLSFIVTQ